MLDESVISKTIIESYLNDLLNNIESDVIIGGAGLSGCGKLIKLTLLIPPIV